MALQAELLDTTVMVVIAVARGVGVDEHVTGEVAIVERNYFLTRVSQVEHRGSSEKTMVTKGVNRIRKP